MQLKDEAIILRKKRYSESSLIVTAYTLGSGKIDFIAKGALRAKSKMSSALMPMTYVNLVYYPKKSGLSLLSEADIARPFYNISASLEHTTVGLLILESLDLKSSESEADQRLFAMTLSSIELLDQHSPNPKNLFLLYQFHLATLLGFKIDLKHTPIADEESNTEYLTLYFSEGRTMHYGKSQIANCHTFSAFVFGKFKEIVSAGFDNFHKIEISPSVFNELTRFFISYFSFHLEKKVHYNSLTLLASSDGI
ncbi:MAG: hypothetical protein Kapaf2KO_17430 [Candidatus Kapaibacteriales bacterium]